MITTRLRRLLAAFSLLLMAAALSGCVAYPAPTGYAYAPVYGYYAAPSVSVGVGFGCCWGHPGWWGWHNHGWR